MNMTNMSGQDLTDAAAARGLDEYAQGAIEDEVAVSLSCAAGEQVVQSITEMVIRQHVDGYDSASAQRDNLAAEIVRQSLDRDRLTTDLATMRARVKRLQRVLTEAPEIISEILSAYGLEIKAHTGIEGELVAWIGTQLIAALAPREV